MIESEYRNGLRLFGRFNVPPYQPGGPPDWWLVIMSAKPYGFYPAAVRIRSQNSTNERGFTVWIRGREELETLLAACKEALSLTPEEPERNTPTECPTPPANP